MRVLVDGDGTVIEGEVIGGTLVSDIDEDYDIADEFKCAAMTGSASDPWVDGRGCP